MNVRKDTKSHRPCHSLLPLLPLLPLLVLAGCLWSSTASAAAQESLIPLPIGVLESPSEAESSPSVRYKEQYQAALFYAIGENEHKLNQCGYRLQIIERYFESTEKPQIKDLANQLQNLGAWIVIAPRRSDHYLIAAQGLTETPAVSLMAGALAIGNLKGPFFSMTNSIRLQAAAAVKAVQKEGYGQRYGALIDASCPACRDFGTLFESSGRGKLKNLFSIDVAGENPDLTELIAKVQETKPDFLLLPNFAALSAYAILRLQDRFPSLKFVGSDGWGDGRVGYFNTFGFKPSVHGFCVRSGSDPSQMNQHFHIQSLDRNWGEGFKPPVLSTFYIITFFRKLTADLCTFRPRTKAALYSRYEKIPKDHFIMDGKFSIYRLENSKLAFDQLVQ